MIMTTSLFTVDGMVHRRMDLVVEHLIDRAVVDGDGRLLISVVDVLAIARLDAEAELVVVHYGDGTSCVLRVADIVDGDDMFLQLQLRDRRGAAGASWFVRLWTCAAGPSPQVSAMSAMSFASFVGLT